MKPVHIQDRFAHGLTKLGFTEAKPTTHYRVFTKPNTNEPTFYLGKAGALRYSRSHRVGDSIPAHDKTKARILADTPTPRPPRHLLPRRRPGVTGMTPTNPNQVRATDVTCPSCNAAPGKLCKRPRSRGRSHRTRRDLAKAIQKEHEIGHSLAAAQAQAEWLADFHRCLKACGHQPTSELDSSALTLYRRGTTPYAAVAELGITDQPPLGMVMDEDH